MTFIFQNRTQAGQLLAHRLTSYAERADVLVLALPRGGVPVAFEIAKKLHLSLDLCLVRKLGVPGREELAMGAIASGGVRVINWDVVDWLHISEGVIEQVAEREKKELERRERLYRAELPFPVVEDKIIILVDDGIATGSTMKAAIAALKQHHPREIIVAVPVAAPITCEELKQEVTQVIALNKPENLSSISLWYEDFVQTSDEEVRQLLAQDFSRTVLSGDSSS